MSAALLLNGKLATTAVRRKRRSDGAICVVARVRDHDRGMPRDWTVYANDPVMVVERLEETRVGKSIEGYITRVAP